MRLLIRVSAVSLALTIALLWVAMTVVGSVGAATLLVTSTADSGAGSLRAAIAAAGNGDTIQFDAALNGRTISVTSTELAIDQNIAIRGPGPNLLTVLNAQQQQSRIFHVLPVHTATIEGLTIRQGGVFNDQATLIMDRCTIQDSYASTGPGGGIYNKGSGGSATLTLLNSTVSNNYADPGCGGICNEAFQGNATLTIVNSTVSGNSAARSGSSGGVGGGICNLADFGSATLTITNSTVSNNVIGAGIPAHGQGGGIHGNGTITITNSVVSGNTAGYVGGGISNGGALTIDGSTLSGNSAIGMRDTFPRGVGYAGGIDNTGALAITNGTLSGNSATFSGGGVTNVGTVTVKNSTLSGNTADVNGGIINGANGTMEIGNTILKAGVSGANISNEGGTVTSHGYNLSNDNGGGFLTATGDQINTDPMLGPLQDNGGPTFTHDLLSGSPAINAGDPSFTPPPSTDQRGYARVFNGRIDIGSVEVQPAPTPGPTPTATASPTATPTSGTFGNISTRLRVETGDNVLIGGFIITGTQPKRIIVRAIGPSLPLAGTLADPVLELRNSSGGLIASNDNWRSDQEAEIIATGIPPSDDLESALVATLAANSSAYTAIVRGANDGSGIGLVEAYDLDQTVDSKLANISTRGLVQTHNNVMIGGLIVLGQNPLRVIVRAIGPSLPVSGALGDPTLELHDGNGALVAFNDNWRSDQEAEIIATGIPPANDLESAIVRNLTPGNYTAIVRGVNDTTGIALVEAYALN